METPEKSLEAKAPNPDLTLTQTRPEAVEEKIETVSPQDQIPDAEPQEAEEVVVAETAAPSEEPTCEVAKEVAPQSIAEVLDVARRLAEKDADEITRDEVSRLKQQFYAFRNAEEADARKAFIEAGNAPEAFEPETNADDEAFKQILNAIKEKKSERAARLEAELMANYEKKEALISEILTLGGDIDNVNRQFPRFREIQQEFKTIGDVPPQMMSDQWKRYQEAIEHFYDQLKVNKDLRDYDFKKNLETKLHLCAEAEELAKDEDIIGAFRRLQELHSKWREIGPVAKEQREEIWNRFKDASAEVNKKYQAFFEERKAREQENEAAKTAICERVEALDFDSLKSFNAWNAMTRTILEAQEDWKKLGFASRKANNALFARFRAVCDKFFTLKAEYYKNVKDDLSANLAKKMALCEQAEALQDSTDWKATAERMTELQKEWKTIGAVPKKQSDAVWARFQKACDHFFEKKKKDLNDSRHAEQANLKAKRALTASLRQIAADAPREEVLAAIADARARWSEIGHVPFREKDKAYEEFRTAINELYKTHDLREQRNSVARFESSINEITDDSKLGRERERLARILEQKRADLATYNNNLGFLNVKSATGSSMLREIERKTQRLSEDIAEIESKIKLIDERL